ncbi:MAG: PepSY-associated TM helix domain-containing protein [Janthinobacterium lividum]
MTEARRTGGGTNKLALRRAWFQVHKWLGLVLAVLVIPLSLSGAALVWHEPLDRALNPARYAVSGRTLLPLGRYVAAARAVLKPGDRVAMLTMPDGGGPVIVAGAPARAPRRPGPPMRTNVYLDPPTARVLEVAASNAGAIRFIHVLHGSLQVPGVGRSIVGWIGVAMALSSVTGLWLWWPVTGSVRRGFRWKRQRNVDGNLHHLLGFWIALPLLVLSVTGMWISFPGVFGGGRPGGMGGGRGPGGPTRPMDRPARAVDRVVETGSALARGGTLRSVTWPLEGQPDWTLGFARRGGPPASVKVADDSGSASPAPARDQGGLARLMRRIHDGEGMGIVWQVVIFAAGIIPAILAVTGIIMWWRARRWRHDVATRRASVRAVAAE